jgi:hypothetical protein
MSNVTDNSSSADLWAQCHELARCKSILSVLDQDLKKYGFAGSTNIPLTIFLATYTRIFPQPVSVVIKGPSSSGKSFALMLRSPGTRWMRTLHWMR